MGKFQLFHRHLACIREQHRSGIAHRKSVPNFPTYHRLMISIEQLHDNIAPLDRIEPNGVDPRKKIIVIGVVLFSVSKVPV